MPYSQRDLNAEEWALLGFIHRHTHGGPAAPDKDGAFTDAYATLVARGLIEHNKSRRIWVITEEGDELLRARYLNSG